MKKIIEFIKQKWLTSTIITSLLIILLILLFIFINLFVQKLDINDIDITQNKLHTLSEQSKNQLKNVNQEINIYLIGYSEKEDIIKQYTRENQNIHYTVIDDIQNRPDLKSKYNITDQTEVIIIETNENNKILTAQDLYTYDYTTYEQIDITEQKITNAIIGLTIQEKPKIYFLTGHNEYGLESHLTILNAYLLNEVNEVESLDLLVKNVIPEDASLIVIGSPQKDFADMEVEALVNYINKGGKILWMQDPELTGKKYNNIQKILDLFGVTFKEGIILEQDSNKIVLQTPNFIIPNITSTKATKSIATDGGIMLVNSGKIDLAEEEKLEELQVEALNILTTSEKSLFRTELENESNTKLSSDEEGCFILGTKLTKTVHENKKSTLYIIANNLFITDYPITVGNNQTPAIYFYNNRDYILNTFAELTNRDDIITIRKDMGVVTYTATKQQDTIIKLIIFLIPILIIIVGLIIWQVRRRK